MPTSRLAALRTALGLESEGMAYYAQARDLAVSRMGRQMFEFLRRSEEDHIRAIKQIYRELEAGGDWPADLPEWEDHSATCKTIFSDALASLKAGNPIEKDDLAALQHAAEFERRGEDFYQRRAEETNDPFERTFYRRLAEEEVGHLRNIEDAIELLENPDGFFLQREAGVRSL